MRELHQQWRQRRYCNWNFASCHTIAAEVAAKLSRRNSEIQPRRRCHQSELEQNAATALLWTEQTIEGSETQLGRRESQEAYEDSVRGPRKCSAEGLTEWDFELSVDDTRLPACKETEGTSYYQSSKGRSSGGAARSALNAHLDALRISNSHCC